MDTLGGLDKVYVCTGYDIDGKIIDTYPASLETLAKAKPVYKEFDGWTSDLSQIRKMKICRMRRKPISSLSNSRPAFRS